MLEPFVLKSRGKDMLCLAEYADYKERGRNVIVIRQGFLGYMSLTYRLMSDFCHILIENSYTTVRFDPLGSGVSEGDSSYMTVYGEIEDLNQVIKHVREEMKPEKIILLGYSLGGLEAAVCANEADVDGLILWSPCSNAYNCIRYILGDRLFFQGMEGSDICFDGNNIGKEFFDGIDSIEIDPIGKIEGFAKPVYLIHGSGDDEVFDINSKRFLDVLPDAHLKIIDGANHSYSNMNHRRELWDITLKYIEDII